MKTTTPGKITLAGANNYKINIRGKAYIDSSIGTYETDAVGDDGRKRAQDAHRWGQPLCHSLIATTRVVKLLNLVLRHGSSVARLQLGGKRMFEKVFLGLYLVGFQGSIENGLETCGSCSCGLCLRHDEGDD